MHHPSLHLFIDDYHIRNVFAMKRVFFKAQRRPEPILVDIPGRGACWATVLREPDGWKERATVAPLKGRKVMVVLQMTSGRAYSVRL